MSTVKILKYIFALSVISFSTVSLQAKAESFHNIPDELLAKAVSSEVVYDEEFDYAKLGTTSNLMSNSGFAEAQAQKKLLVDRVVVNKAAHQMILMKDGQEVRKFWIALSDKPYGKKQFEGDKKTPEGTYTLDYIKKDLITIRLFIFHIQTLKILSLLEAMEKTRRHDHGTRTAPFKKQLQ